MGKGGAPQLGPPGTLVLPAGTRITLPDGTTVVVQSAAGLGDGSAAAPSLAFAADTDTGLYRPGDNATGFVSGGLERFRVDGLGPRVINGATLLLEAASAAVPSVRFNVDHDLGFYRVAADVLGVAAGGAEALRVAAGGISFDAGANFLGRYVSGDWTPVYQPSAGSFTTLDYSTNVGHFLRIGRWVVCIGQIATSSVTVGSASGDLRIAGLPVPIDHGTNVPAVGSITLRGFAAAIAPYGIATPAATDHVLVDVTASNATSVANLTVANMTTGAVAFRNVARFMFVYRAAS